MSSFFDFNGMIYEVRQTKTHVRYGFLLYVPAPARGHPASAGQGAREVDARAHPGRTDERRVAQCVSEYVGAVFTNTGAYALCAMSRAFRVAVGLCTYPAAAP